MPTLVFGRNVGSHWALEQAKYNLVNEYMLVGVTEELEDFVMMLEAALPRFFKGATDLYKTGARPTGLPSFCWPNEIDDATSTRASHQRMYRFVSKDCSRDE